MSKPLTLSLVIPAYNEERHLEACLNAVALQTVKPDEVIVVDSYSTDKTAEIAKRYPFVKIFEENQLGIVFARDRGFDAATSDIIGRIDADSVLPPEWCAKAKEYYEDPKNQQTAWTSGCYFYNVRWPRFYGWVHYLLAFRLNRFLLGYDALWGSNMALPIGLWREARSKVCQLSDIHEDLDLAIHLHQLGYVTKYVSQPKVGAKLRRVRSDHHLLWQNLLWWPRTLRLHQVKGWVVCWVFGAGLIYVMSPMPIIIDRIARLFGAKPLPE